MDNVTHALAGLLIAECADQLRASKPNVGDRAGGWDARGMTALLAAVAANLPDADLLYTGAGGNALAYMLHHRGYTHTVLLAVLGAIGLWLVGAAWARYRDAALSADGSRWLLGTMLVGTLSHLLLDFTNSYGVHPFWPFDARWFYGDSVFIVEPAFWVVSVPTLVLASRSRVARGLLSLLLVAGLGLAWRVPLVTRYAAIGLTVGAVVSVFLSRRAAAPTRAFGALGAWIAVTLAMVTGTAIARRDATAGAMAAGSGVRVLDVVASPLPSNPLCSSVITVEQVGDRYAVQMARVSAWPSLVKPASCPVYGNGGPTFTASTRPSSDAVHWDRMWSVPVADLRALSATSCRVNAALHFLRVPVWQAISASDVRLGDARFGGAASGNLSLRSPRVTTDCDVPVPGWTPPRDDLLR